MFFLARYSLSTSPDRLKAPTSGSSVLCEMPFKFDTLSNMEQLIPELSRRMTEEEYLRFGEAAKSKHEFWHGTLIDMAGATTDHVRISSNLIRHLGDKLDGKPCAAYTSDLRGRIKETGDYVYPDVTSPSTDLRDRVEKLDDYQRLESLVEYFLVSQDRARVQSFFRQGDGIWAFGPSNVDLSQTAVFRSLGLEIPLADIYAGIEFPAPQPTPAAEP